MTSLYEQARSITLIQLPSEGLTRETIEAKVRGTIELLTGGATDQIDTDRLVREIESMCKVWMPTATTMDNDEDHLAWLEGKRADVEWRFWSRYERYLRDVVGMPPVAIKRLDEVTDTLLARFEDPERPGSWDRRGLVVGQVQSGKTQNYTGVICKAIDAGYRLIVVLAGLHNSLRSQTQLRLDEGVLGFDTRTQRKFDLGNTRVGVGELPGEFLHANSFTSSLQSGDFSLSVARNIGVSVGGADPVILVVKKNKSILNNLHRWATGIRKEIDPETSRSIVRGVPLLLIDDEADNASVDTRDSTSRGDDEYSPSVINGLIRQLLRSFDQSVYLGYTATPFANIFIDSEADTDRYGKDLFPSGFIISLPTPSTYIGPARVFGLRAEVGKNIEEVKPLPIVRDIDDQETWVPDRHKSDITPGLVPASLRTAVLSFLLAGAVKTARGLDRSHHSMLVHVTRYTAVQRRVSVQLQELLEEMRLRLRYGDGDRRPTLLDELRDLFETDFVPTAESAQEHLDLADQFGVLPQWATVSALLAPTAERTIVKTINGTADDALEYRDHPEGASVIAVGGDKLSRGLTLEGLTVSYYLRASRMYDTLMQMGRWFGYRPGYLDICRLYTTDELSSWYQSVTAANEELIREFEYMAAVDKSPREFGLRVQQHPDGLLVTARTKLRHARRLSISFAGDITETIIFQTDEKVVKRNAELAAAFADASASLGVLRPRKQDLASYQWSGVPPEPVLEFLRGYTSHEAALKVIPKTLCDYIEARNTDEIPELTDWTVLLVSNGTAAPDEICLVGAQRLGLVTRAQYPENIPHPNRYSIRRLLSPTDEIVDLNDATKSLALDFTRLAWAASTRKGKSEAEPTVPSGIAVRRQRPPERGLIMVYPLNPANTVVPGEVPVTAFAISFPYSERAKPVDYQVNNIYWEQEFDFIDDEVEPS